MSPTAASAQQHEVHLRFNISANTQRHRQRSSSARHTPGQRNLSIWQLGGGSLYLRSGSGQHQRQPRQHLCSSMRSPSASHLRVVSMSVQHQARSVCDWPYMGGIGNNGGNRHRRHITSTSAASAFQPQHQRSCSSAATHGAVCWRQQSNIIYACTIICFFFSGQSAIRGKFYPDNYRPYPAVRHSSSPVSRWTSASELVLLYAPSSHPSLSMFQTATRTTK